MKKTLLFVVSLLITTVVSGQANFKWEITDSIPKTKNEIYSLTKMFIAETWKSAQAVIQNDDKESGLILIKGSTIEGEEYWGTKYIYVYNYTVTFRMKDNRYKMTLDNVYCEKAYVPKDNYSVTKIEPFDGDNCPETGTYQHIGISKKKAIEMMNRLRQSLQNLVDYYPIFLNKEIEKDDW